jgi:serine protease Do
MKARFLGALRAALTVASISAVVSVVALPLQAAQAQSRTLPDFTDLVEQVGPSVVNIRTSEKVTLRSAQGGPSEEEMLDFFRRFGLPVPNVPKQAPKKSQPHPQEEDQPKGVGSGFILSSDGLIMTNAHVVDGADEVLVTLTDKREFKAKIIGADKRSDVALVKIEATGLPAVKVGDVNK